jgi:nitrogen fixation NifU-like protein
LEDADGVGTVGNPVCGDLMTIYIKVKDDTIEDIKFQTFGCAAAIATSSIATELAKGKKLDEALKITRDVVAEELGGLPKQKMHCSNLAADALKRAIVDYLRKTERYDRIKELGLEKELEKMEKGEIDNHGEYCEA